MSSQVLEKTATANVGAVGLKAVLNIFSKWGCSNEQIQKILSVSRAALHNYKHNPQKAKLTSDQLERVSYILNIHASLRTIFSNPENQYGFMKMPNNNPYFNGKTPLELIATGQFGVLYEVFKRIDTMRGGAW